MDIQILKTTLANVTADFERMLPPSGRRCGWKNILSLNGMVITKNQAGIDEYCELWEKFLNGLDKFWNRLNAFVKDIPDSTKKEQLIGYLGNINDKRNNDELLFFLDKARNSAQHSIYRHIRGTKKNETHVDGRGYDLKVEGNRLKFIEQSGDGDKRLYGFAVWEEGTLLICDFNIKSGNSNTITHVKPPENHNGKIIMPAMDRIIPSMIGKKGLEFYHDVLEEFENRLNR